jgi:hypothetical protein
MPQPTICLSFLRLLDGVVGVQRSFSLKSDESGAFGSLTLAVFEGLANSIPLPKEGENQLPEVDDMQSGRIVYILLPLNHSGLRRKDPWLRVLPKISGFKAKKRISSTA